MSEKHGAQRTLTPWWPRLKDHSTEPFFSRWPCAFSFLRLYLPHRQAHELYVETYRVVEGHAGILRVISGLGFVGGGFFASLNRPCTAPDGALGSADSPLRRPFLAGGSLRPGGGRCLLLQQLNFELFGFPFLVGIIKLTIFCPWLLEK